ncbi:hypothetical protein [Dechloromonas sp. ARDL1]|uniref:hypothetical protein n=1 Tax=Dechloromonas sp. ARDL1 TaxID=3322121 RepID=UPI003DA71C80
MFNVLQDHGIVLATPDGKAIWKATESLPPTMEAPSLESVESVTLIYTPLPAPAWPSMQSRNSWPIGNGCRNDSRSCNCTASNRTV